MKAEQAETSIDTALDSTQLISSSVNGAVNHNPLPNKPASN